MMRLVMNLEGFRARFGRCAACLVVWSAFAALPAWSDADVMFGESSSFGVSADVDLSLVGGILTSNLGVAPTSMSSGTAPGPYSDMGSNPGVSASAGLGIIPNIITLDTGLLSTTADSDVTSTSSSGFVNSTASIDGLSLEIIGSFLSLQAETITSSADISGSAGSLTAVGDATLLDSGGGAAVLSVLGVDFLLDASVPNTSILIDSSLVPGLDGTIGVFINEQILTGDGFNDPLSLDVNALRLDLDANVNVAGLGLVNLNGDLVFAHSEASLTAVPEPSSMMLLSVLGVGAVAGRVRQRRKRAQHDTGKA